MTIAQDLTLSLLSYLIGILSATLRWSFHPYDPFGPGVSCLFCRRKVQDRIQSSFRPLSPSIVASRQADGYGITENYWMIYLPLNYRISEGIVYIAFEAPLGISQINSILQLCWLAKSPGGTDGRSSQAGRPVLVQITQAESSRIVCRRYVSGVALPTNYPRLLINRALDLYNR